MWNGKARSKIVDMHYICLAIYCTSIPPFIISFFNQSFFNINYNTSWLGRWQRWVFPCYLDTIEVRCTSSCSSSPCFFFSFSHFTHRNESHKWVIWWAQLETSDLLWDLERYTPCFYLQIVSLFLIVTSLYNWVISLSMEK